MDEGRGRWGVIKNARAVKPNGERGEEMENERNKQYSCEGDAVTCIKRLAYPSILVWLMMNVS